MKTRVIALVLAVLVLMLAVVSCGAAGTEQDDPKETQNGPDKQTQSGESVPAKETEPETTWYEPEKAKDKDYGGADFVILTFPHDTSIYWHDTDFTYYEISGDTIGDAVVNRNEYVSEHLGVNLVFESLNQTNDTATLNNAVAGGLDEYQIAFLYTQGSFEMATKGNLVELHTMEDLQLDAPWWDQNSLRDMSILGQNYAMFGNIGIMYRKTIGVFMFNKELYEENASLENPYTLVANKAWTIDKMIEIVTQTYQDFNGNGDVDEGDIFGMIYQGDGFPIAMMGAGVQFISKDNDDIPYMNYNNDHTLDVFDELCDLFYDTTYARSVSAVAPKLETPLADYFNNGQALFRDGEIHSVIGARQMTQNFGVLPQPLYDSDQENYVHCINPHVAATMVIPNSNKDLSRTAIVADALSAAGKNYLDPAFYDITLQGRSVRDNESRESIELVVSTVRYDIGYLSDWGISWDMMDLANRRSTDFVSKYGTSEPVVQGKLDDTIAAFERME